MNKRSLLLIFGGESPEHEVSISSVVNVHDALNKNKYDITLCYIDREGRWWRVDEAAVPAELTNSLTPLLGEGTLQDANGERLKPDVLMPILHGTNGEDGSVQGLAQLLHVPIVGCGILGSAVCMDKDVTKRLLLQAGLPVVEYVLIRAGDPRPSYDELRAKLGDTLFIKPANMGSSVGVSKASDTESFTTAVDAALKYDRKVLVERAIAGRELECSVLGNNHPEASAVGEVVPGDEFYTYEAKYNPGSGTQTTTQADLSPELTGRIREIAVQAYRALECCGMARVDFFLTSDNQTYVNELNTLPGFTNISMYPQLWEAGGLSYSSLLDRLVDLALE